MYYMCYILICTNYYIISCSYVCYNSIYPSFSWSIHIWYFLENKNPPYDGRDELRSDPLTHQYLPVMEEVQPREVKNELFSWIEYMDI